MTKKEKIKEILENLEDGELISINNQYNEECNCDDYIYYVDELDDILCGKTPLEVLNLIYYGDFNPNDNYFVFDGYGNLKSSNYIEDFLDFDELAKYIIDNDNDFENDEIKEILEEEDANDE